MRRRKTGELLGIGKVARRDAGGVAELVAQRGEQLHVAAREHDLRAAGGQATGDRRPKASAGSGQQHLCA